MAMQMAGHKTRAIFDRYRIVSDGDLREAAQKLARLESLQVRVFEAKHDKQHDKGATMGKRETAKWLKLLCPRRDSNARPQD